MIKAQSISAMNPLGVLARGYSVTTKNGRAVKSSEELEIGDTIDIRLDKGGASAEVKRIRG